MGDRKRLLRQPQFEHLIFILIALLILVADQLSKNWVIAQLTPGQSMDLATWLAPVLQFTHITNTGVAFGMLPQLGNIFKYSSSIVSVLILVYYYFLPPRQLLTRISLGILFGGSLGNLFDRFLRGSVVDFIDVNFWPLHNWPIFNISDASIVVGVALLALTMFLEERRELKTEESTP